MSITVLLAYITRNSIQAGFALPTNFQKFKSGADPGFQVRGGALKKFAPSAGRREHFWDLSCEKSRFYAKKSYFFPIAEGDPKIFGVFRVKNHDFTPKNHIFSNFRGGARAGCAPLGSAPANVIFLFVLSVCQYLWIIKFLEWAYRKKGGDVRGYFHRLGYWGFIFRLILLRFSFVFYINLPIRKSYRIVLSFRFWALFDYWIFPTCHV